MRTRAGLLAAGLVALLAWIYAPALRGGWIWDDLAEIPHNPVLPDPAGLARIWSGAASPDYFPLKTTVQWCEWRLWGSQPLGYHAVSLALHALSALLLWRLLRQLGVRHGWIGGLLFAVHPLAVESVAWISELKNTLSLPPLLIALSAYLVFDDREPAVSPATRRRAYAVALAAFLIAMLCKSTVTMFPVVLLLFARWRRGRLARTDFVAAAPFFGIALGLGLVTVWFQLHRAANGADLAIGGLLSRSAAAGLSLVFYLGKTFCPFGLMPNYPRWSVVPPAVGQFWPWLVLGALTLALGTRRGPWGRAALLGWACFVVNLVPVLGFVPMSYLRISWVADHFAYLALAAAAAGVGAGASAGVDWLAARGRTRLGPAYALLLAVAAVLAAESRSYARIYRDEASFWTYAATRNPDSWVAQNDLGLTLALAGRVPAAIAHYETALRENPDYAEAHLNLGNALVQLGRYAEAIPAYQWVVHRYPAHADTYAYLGIALARTGRLAEAVAAYQTALQLTPQLPETENNLGNALARLGRPEAAQAAYAAALRLRPDYAEAECNWGNLLSDAGQLGAAAGHYQHALQLQPRYAEADYRWANALANAGQVAAAIPRYEEAVQWQPGFAEARANLGLALAGEGQLAPALAQLRAAVNLKPDYAEAHAYLGFALAQAGQLPAAIAEYQTALRLEPNNPDMHYQLALALRASGQLAQAAAEFATAARLGGHP